jgi:hypothetical protein
MRAEALPKSFSINVAEAMETANNARTIPISRVEKRKSAIFFIYRLMDVESMEGER